MEKSTIPPTGAQNTLNNKPMNKTSRNLQDHSSGKTSKDTIKGSISGGLLSRIPFLRSNPNPKLEDDFGNGTSGTSPTLVQHEHSTNTISAPRVRSRQGSLRKAALLSLGKTRSDKERKTQVSDLHGLKIPPDEIHPYTAIDDSSILPSPDSDDHPTPSASTDHDNVFKVELQEGTTSEESLPQLKPDHHLQQKNLSTPDEDESIRVSARSRIADQRPPIVRSGREDYFSASSSLPRKHTIHARSPLSALPIESTPIPEEWDYLETEWWGWFILIITWIVFVIGMGSCFEVWSWAWAVGKTPYAPPELEDDPTLPIVGYYPALIILTGVMAWIWVFTAWVGMKYFRHAKIS